MPRPLRALAASALVLALLVALPARAPAEEDFAAKKKAAIDKAIAYLKAQQKDGAWDYENLHPKLGEKNYPMRPGIAALGALALLKAGVPPTDPVVKKALAVARSGEIEHVYSAGLVLLMLEALVHWEPAGEGEGTQEHKTNKAEGSDLALAQRCVEFLARSQLKQLWRYRMGQKGGDDSSNAQYALLGLDAAERLGIQVNKEIYAKAIEWYLENQEKDGPEVPAFPIPGADLSIAELRKIEKEAHEKLAKIAKGFAGRKPGEPDADGHMKEDLIRAAEEETAKQVFGTREKLPKMHARGFPYQSKEGEAESGKDKESKEPYYGSMTASGLVCVFVCKAHLDGTPLWDRIKGDANRALRDGAAWMAKNWSVEKNPNRPYHLDYYLYALERAGVMNMLPRFGDHDWYGEGCKALIAQQQADGSFDCGKKTSVGPTVDSMFALLFLARGTTPIIRLPEKVVTGQH